MTQPHPTTDPNPPPETQRQLGRLEILSEIAVEAVRTLHRRMQQADAATSPSDAASPVTAQLLHALREARALVALEAKVVHDAHIRARALKAEQRTEQAAFDVSHARAARNRHEVKLVVDSAIATECPPEQAEFIRLRAEALLADMTDAELSRQPIDEIATGICQDLNLIAPDMSWMSVRWLTRAKNTGPP